jgi:hypothetical protein
MLTDDYHQSLRVDWNDSAMRKIVPLLIGVATIATGCGSATKATPASSSSAVTAVTATTSAVAKSSNAPVNSTAAATTTSVATAATSGADTTPAIVAATTVFLATLTDAERKAVQFDFTDKAQRQKWSNLPEGLYTRAGLMWGNMTDASKAAWLTVMQATMSKEGFERVQGEQAADEALATQPSGGGPGGLKFGARYYWVAVIGTPSETAPWQWQWGGHHVTVNATIVGTSISLTPSFIGAQPATFDANGNKVRPIGDIEDDAFALVNSLDATQKPKAVLGGTLIDLILGPGQDGKNVQAEGLSGADMTPAQQAAMLKLMDHYGDLLNAEDAASRDADLKANLAKTSFVWYGPTAAGSGMYFRISGPTVVIEYSGQSMGGNSANHIHGIYRDPTNDYGAAIGAGIA